jgi:amylosucrase
MYNDSEHSLLSEILLELELKHGKLAGRNSIDFVSRLSANFSTIRELFMSMYGLQSDRERRFRQLISSLYLKFQQRSKVLKKQDRKRVAKDQWVLSQKWVGMTLYPEHFAKTVSGFHKRISYLEELGVNLVHLMPVLESPKTETDGGYAVTNYRKVKPHLGKMSDIKTIAKKFRKRKILLTLDLVLNHTSHHHLWAKKAKKGKK